jgi:redox-sensitive bicupin YhaK (pirin superfamily)
VTGPDQRVVLAPDDGSLGPLLRVADDRLAPGQAYGRHGHRAVDVVAVVLAGELAHAWGAGARLAAGDVAVLRAGTGLDHDEVAGPHGARVLQCYLRSADPGAPPSHEVHPAAAGWVPLERPDAGVWHRRLLAGQAVQAPAGLVLRTHGDDDVVVERAAEPVRIAGPATVVVWRLEVARPAWAE